MHASIYNFTRMHSRVFMQILRYINEFMYSLCCLVYCIQLDFPVKPKGQLQKENDTKFLQMLKDQRRDGRTTEHGLYEMLQEYMIENEMLRFDSYLYPSEQTFT